MPTELELSDRKAILTVDTISIECGGSSGLDIEFHVEKSTKSEPNTCEIRIFNLTTDHRAQLAQAAKTGVAVALEAGYAKGTATIAEGELRYVYSSREGSDIVTTLSSGDGDTGARKSRISKSYGLDTPVRAVLSEVAKACKVGEGNLSTALSNAILKGSGSSAFKGGTTVSGNAYQELVRLAASCGLTVSIQHGKFQFLTADGGSLAGTAFELSSTSGLIGSPSVSPTKDGKGALRAQLLMVPDVFPGRKIVMKSEFIKGGFVVQKARYTGQTFGDDWGIDIEATAL